LDSPVAQQPAAAVAQPPAAETRPYRWLALPITVFALVSLTAGLLAAHDPRSKGYFRLFFSDPVHLKAGFATAAAVLATVQLVTAGWIFRTYPWPKPAWINPVHRWSGRLAFVFVLPVAYHCIFKLGFQDPDRRVLAHSLLGTTFFGAYAAKVTIVRLHRFPRPVLPVAGGLVFSLLIGLWYTSSLWLYKRDREARTAPPPAAVAPTPPPPQANVASGKQVFSSAGCSGCHTLKAAGATGSVGPNLDQLRPTFDQVKTRVEQGAGVMPSFKGKLTDAQIRDVAAFVSQTAGR
jgi:mono/diheme cytochrome c family protein